MCEYLFDIPPELRAKIYSYCSVPDLKHVACCSSMYNDELRALLWRTVSIPWQTLAENDFTNSPKHLKKLQYLAFTSVLCFTGGNYSQLAGFNKPKLCENYKTILEHCNPDILDTINMHDMYEFDVDGQCIQFTCDLFKTLKRFAIDYAMDTIIPVEAYTAISTLDMLSELSLDSSLTDDFNLSILCNGLAGLTLLDISHSKITDYGLFKLNIKSLGTLNIRDCNISDLGLSYISTLVKLKEIDISFCKKVTDRGIACFLFLPLLEKLYVHHCKVTDASMLKFCEMTSLRKLGMSGCVRITNKGLQSLSKLKSLVELNISDITGITDFGISCLSELTSLKILDVHRTQLSDVGLCAITNLCLRSLNIGRTKVKDGGLKSLSRMMSLETLVCWDTGITDAGLQDVHLLRNLRHLDISSCHQVTDIAVKHLTAMKSSQNFMLRH